MNSNSATTVPWTIRTYLSMLVQLSRHYSLSPEKITTEQIKEYLFYCKEKRGLSNSFINQTISAVKILRQDVVGLCWDEGIKIKRPRKDHLLARHPVEAGNSRSPSGYT